MSEIVRPFFFKNEIHESGSFPQPEGMSERAYWQLYGAGNLVDPVPSDFLEKYNQEEVDAMLAIAPSLVSGCYHCRPTKL